MILGRHGNNGSNRRGWLFEWRRSRRKRRDIHVGDGRRRWYRCGTSYLRSTTRFYWFRELLGSNHRWLGRTRFHYRQFHWCVFFEQRYLQKATKSTSKL